MRVYIINGRATRNKLDDRSHRDNFIGYAATTGVIIYWKPDQPFIIHRDHHVWFDEYNYRLSIEYKHTPGCLLLSYLPFGKKISFNLLDDEDFTIPYITYPIPNSSDVYQLPSQANRNVWIVAIHGEEPIKDQGVLDELNCHQTPRGKSNIKISLCRRKSYQRTDLEDIRSIFDQVRPVFSHLEVHLPNKPPTPDNIGDALGGPQRQFKK